MQIHVVPQSEWVEMAEVAHRAVFNEPLPTHQIKTDFTLLALKNDDLMGYVTCREISSSLLYWSFGGSFPAAHETHWSWVYFRAMVEKCQELGFKQIMFMVGNQNKVMLKAAAKMGFMIVGMRTLEGSLSLEHRLELP